MGSRNMNDHFEQRLVAHSKTPDASTTPSTDDTLADAQICVRGIVMAEQLTNPQGPALDLFPLFGQYEAMAAQELEGLTDPQLDWTSPRWGWSGWSIRNNISHVASHLFRWYILRWGDQIFPEGIPYRDEVDYLAALSHRQLDKEQWWEIDVILGKLGEAIAMVHGILANETLGSLRAKTIDIESPGFYDRFPRDTRAPSLSTPRTPTFACSPWMAASTTARESW